MKKIALFLSVVIATAMADTAAAKPDTLSIDKTYYPGRRAFYELTPVKKHNIVMLGNSLTERGLWGEYFQPAYVLNRGIGGDCVSGMIARLETILPAPESAHAIYQAIQEAKKCAETGEEKVILFGLTGTGYFDMYAYEAFNKGEMVDHIPTDEELQMSFDGLPKV